jgi:hypothetical protein
VWHSERDEIITEFTQTALKCQGAIFESWVVKKRLQNNGKLVIFFYGNIQI